MLKEMGYIRLTLDLFEPIYIKHLLSDFYQFRGSKWDQTQVLVSRSSQYNTESKSNDNLYTTWHCPNCHGSLNTFFIYQGLHLALSCKAPPMLASCLGEYFQIFPLGHTQFALPNHCFQTFASMHCFLSSVPP